MYSISHWLSDYAINNDMVSAFISPIITIHTFKGHVVFLIFTSKY